MGSAASVVADGAPRFCGVTSTTENIYILSLLFSLIAEPQSSFWSPSRIGAVIGVVP